MSRETFSYTHGDTGNRPSGGLDFQSNQRPDAEKFDWYWYNVVEAIKGHAEEFDRLDSNDDGQVDSADYADNAGQLDGEEATAFADAVHNHDTRYLNDDTGTVTETNLAFDPAKQGDLHSRYTDSEARTAVDGANVSIAGDADTLDGNHASAFSVAGHTHDGRYYTESQVDSNFASSGHTHDGRYYTQSEVQNWVNNNADVPNANYADDAGQLNGRSPSYYEIPEQTGGTSVTGGYLSDYDTTMSVGADGNDWTPSSGSKSAVVANGEITMNGARIKTSCSIAVTGAQEGESGTPSAEAKAYYRSSPDGSWQYAGGSFASQQAGADTTKNDSDSDTHYVSFSESDYLEIKLEGSVDTDGLTGTFGDDWSGNITEGVPQELSVVNHKHTI